MPPVRLLPPPISPVKFVTLASYMDAAAHELREGLRNVHGLARPGSQIVVGLLDHVLFEDNSARLTAPGASAITTVSKIARRYDRTFLYVTAFTDVETASGQKLAQERAQVVADSLIAGGVRRGRIGNRGITSTRLHLRSGKRISVPTDHRVEIRIWVPSRG